MAESETTKKTSTSSIMPDWSLLPEELLHIIIDRLDNCFNVVHARSVCRSWRSTFPFPSCLLRPSYSLPMFTHFRRKSKDLFTLEKIPLFLFRVPTLDADVAEYFMGGIGRDKSNDHMELPSPLQCSVKVEIPGSDPTLMNMLDYKIFHLGYQYRMIGCNPDDYKGVAFLPLNKEGGEFVVLLNYSSFLLVLTSAEMRWKRLENVLFFACLHLVTFRGRFYATFHSGKTVVIDPYSLEVTFLLPSPRTPVHYLVPSSNDDLFLVEVIFQTVGKLTCRVSRLDEEAGQWVEVSDLGDRVLFVGGHLGNISCSAQELPHGLSGNSILFTNGSGKVTFPYKYGVHTGNAEDDLDCWRSSMEDRVVILNKSFPVLAFKVEC
ncbi:F-box domain [Arabidopsis thaliana x Arabidopsis arenosa]|uniref:F-box domain n=1 Tax=Arabidopsis thaliana x Arabidopsis arenosa TaxID=1240361 RepID=A0A8T2A6G0_9BRAS|nr:F-box domain [Arabidopsis thaliana x Arabidopsis arenosa]